MPKLIISFNPISLINDILGERSVDEIAAMYSFYMFTEGDFKVSITNHGTCDVFECSVTYDLFHRARFVRWSWYVVPFGLMTNDSYKLVGQHMYFDRSSPMYNR